MEQVRYLSEGWRHVISHVANAIGESPKFGVFGLQNYVTKGDNSSTIDWRGKTCDLYATSFFSDDLQQVERCEVVICDKGLRPAESKNLVKLTIENLTTSDFEKRVKQAIRDVINAWLAMGQEALTYEELMIKEYSDAHNPHYNDRVQVRFFVKLQGIADYQEKHPEGLQEILHTAENNVTLRRADNSAHTSYLYLSGRMVDIMKSAAPLYKMKGVHPSVNQLYLRIG